SSTPVRLQRPSHCHLVLARTQPPSLRSPQPNPHDIEQDEDRVDHVQGKDEPGKRTEVLERISRSRAWGQRFTGQGDKEDAYTPEDTGCHEPTFFPENR